MKLSHFIRFGLIGVVFALTATSIAGCMGSVKGKGALFVKEEPRTYEANVYHYRTPRILVGIRAQYDVLCNDAPITRIGNGGYFKHTLKPGKAVIKTRLTAGGFGPLIIDTAIANYKAQFKEAFTFNAEAGKTYFLKYTVPMSDEKPFLEQMNTEEALQEMNGLRSFKSLEECLKDEKDANELSENEIP